MFNEVGKSIEGPGVAISHQDADQENADERSEGNVVAIERHDINVDETVRQVGS